MAQIPSDKPIKVCPICKKEVRNLGLHISNQHPNVLAKLDDFDEPTPKNRIEPDILTKKAGSIGEMVKEHLDTMLNLQLIQMLGKGASVGEVQRVLNPTEEKTSGVTIEDVKKYHDLVYKENQDAVNINVGDSDGAGWVNLANNALPIISKLMDGRMQPKNNEENKENDEHTSTTGTIEEAAIRPIGFISEEAAVDTTEPRSVGEEPRVIEPAEQQDSGSVERSSSGTD